LKKLDIKRNYAPPADDLSKLRQNYFEEFYNQSRIKDIFIGEDGKEQVPSLTH
jgi:hypothetical protein